MSSFFEQRIEPGSGAVECADFAEQLFNRPITGITIHVPSDLIAQDSTAASEEVFNRRGEREIASDHFHRATLAGDVVSEDPRDVAPGDVG